MQVASAFDRIRSGPARTMLALMLVLEVGVAVAVGVSVRNSRRATEQDAQELEQHLRLLPIDAPAKPILHPKTVAASGATIGPGEPVIGVVVDGKSRAYRLRALDAPEAHLVNDHIGKVPVLVTYCNLNQCVRVFTDAPGRGPLDAEVAGLFRGEMVIRIGDALYFQESGAPFDPAENPVPIPYAHLESTLTLWKNWKAVHPETDVYQGDSEALAN